jgi:hypothetical protein
MGRMKEVFMLKREQEAIEDQHLDDAYWYQKYLEEQQMNQQPVVQESVQNSVQEPVQHKPKEQC